jgi:hypothetical protein
MAVTLNALTTGVGGLQTTGDTSGQISLQSNGSTVLAVTASGVSVTGTLSSTNALPATSGGTGLTSVGSNGNVLTSNGTTWTSAALPAGGVTSLNGQTGAITNTDFGSIGSYFVGSTTASGTTVYAAGATVAGSALIQNSATGSGPFLLGAPSTDYTGAGFSGTWRNMAGRVASGAEYVASSYRVNTIWVRIS